MRYLYRLLLVVLVGWLSLPSPSHALEQSISHTFQDAAAATGDGIPLNMSQYTSVGVTVDISATATVTFEVKGESTTWGAILCTLTSDGSAVSAPTASGLYQCNVAGMQLFRARISSYGSGTVTVVGRATTASLGSGGGGGSAVTGTVAIDQTTPGTTNAVALSGLISGEDQANNLLMQSGGAVRQNTKWTGITTNTTSAVDIVPVGVKTFYGEVNGTGAVTQTQKIYGGPTSGVTATTGVELCSWALSGTTHAHSSCQVTTPWSFFIVVTSSTTGTGATGAVTPMY